MNTPSDFQENLEEARRRHQAGDFQFATDVYREVLSQDPKNAKAMHLLGLAAHQMGNHAEALNLMQAAEAIEPHNLKIKSNIGSVYMATGESEKAAASFQAAQKLDPNDGELALNLGLAERACDRQESAFAAFEKACQQLPDDAEVWFRKAEQAQVLDRFEDAVSAYRRTLELRPGLLPALVGLGIAHQKSGNHDAAAECYRTALEAHPDSAELHFQYAALALAQMQIPLAIERFETGLALDPTNADAQVALGEAFAYLGDFDRAYERFQIVVEGDPSHAGAAWRAAFGLPLIYRDESEIVAARARYEQGLSDWQRRDDLARSIPQTIGTFANDRLAEQGQDDLDLQRLYGTLVGAAVSQAMPRTFNQVGRRRDRRRIGFLSANFHDGQPVQKLFSGWLRYLDRDKFEIFTFSVGPGGENNLRAVAEVSENLLGTPWRPSTLAAHIQESELDVLIYPDIASSPYSQVLAAMKLARVQCATWGHPSTTGYSTIDYFLSSDLMERPDADANYTEKLIRLPNLSVNYARPDTKTAKFPDINGEKPEVPTFLCGPAIQKLLPQFDNIYPQVAKTVGDCRFWFVGIDAPHAMAIFDSRLAAAFSDLGLRSEDYCTIYPPLHSHDLSGLLAASDVVLDPILWSGADKSLEAFAHGRPVVTLPGSTMRSRHTYAMLQRMRIPELIAADVDDYISIAANLAQDSRGRSAIEERIAKENYVLFGDREPIGALREFLIKASD